ncbi:hypothetical protein [Modestobacter sp. SYSU DS0657]
MSAASDGSGTGPVEEPVAQTGRPPVPGRAPADDGRDGRQDAEPGGEGRHSTERVPFPLPELHQHLPEQAPGTGRLQLGGYPPRVPGAIRRPDAAPGDRRTDWPDEDGDPRSRS